MKGTPTEPTIFDGPRDQYCTRWFNAQEHKPTRKGFYQVRNAKPVRSTSNRCLNGPNVRYWNGRRWLAVYGGEPMPTIFGRESDHEWRGLTLDPRALEGLTLPMHLRRRGLVRGQ